VPVAALLRAMRVHRAKEIVSHPITAPRSKATARPSSSICHTSSSTSMSLT
jgi:hypothetical protein